MDVPIIPVVPTLSQLVREFGLQNVQVQQPVKNPYDSKIPQTVNIDPSTKSVLGTPIFTTITFQSATYTDAKGNPIITPQLVFETIIITVTQAKKIVRTEIQGRNGTVKEYIGDSDYEVTIQGKICGPNGHYPIDEVRALKTVLDAPVAIGIVNAQLQTLDIHNLVISDYTFDQKEGSYSDQAFSINAISDLPIILMLGNV